MKEGAKTWSKNATEGFHQGCMMRCENTSRKLIDLGAIWPSNSPWASAVVLVRKKNGKLHFFIDLRKLNSLMVRDAYSIPWIWIQGTLHCLQSTSLVHPLRPEKCRYWQVELEEANTGSYSPHSRPPQALQGWTSAIWADRILQLHFNVLWGFVWETCSFGGALFIWMTSSFLQLPQKSMWRGFKQYCPMTASSQTEVSTD